MADIKNFAVDSTEKMEEQIEEFANSVAYKNEKIRIMPDGHVGKGCVIGSTMTFSDKIVPNTVGVDIACRVSLYALGININNLSDDFFEKFDKMVEERIPTGFNVRDKEAELSKNFPYEELKCYSALNNMDRIRKSMGTLGGGNHYLELDVDDDGDIYLSIHCGTRNLGKQVCEYYQNLAIKNRDEYIKTTLYFRQFIIDKCKENGRTDLIQNYIEECKGIIEKEMCPDDLCYIDYWDGVNYLDDMRLCNKWSELNHQVIYEEIMDGLGDII